jgi:8-oxo-dGTP pyrophosphatase MutT (NUDIX family)
MALTNAEKQAAWRERRQTRLAELEATVKRQAARIAELEAENERLRNPLKGENYTAHGVEPADDLLTGMFDNIDPAAFDFVAHAEAEKRARAARQSEENKKPRFKGKQMSPPGGVMHAAVVKFQKCLALAARGGTRGEGDAAEAAARRVMEEAGINPTHKSLDHSWDIKSIKGNFASNPLLVKLREEHRTKYRQRVV